MAVPVASQSNSTRSAAGKQARPVVIAFSAGIRRVRHLQNFLHCEVVSPQQAPADHEEIAAVIVWGRKSTTAAAIRFATEHKLPVWYLEDGWIRTSSSDAHSRNCYSLIVDKQGVYYDPSTPSDIESLLNLSDSEFANEFDSHELQRAKRCRSELIEHNITKYNYCKTADIAGCIGVGSYVLVIDQTLDDASVICGGMTQARFNNMLEAAIAENPDKKIVVRTHPDVAAGIKEGYLSARARQLNVPLLAGDDNPLQWVKQATCVYTGTSQLGYEALLAETPVVVFGKPFYAGWGLTDDRQELNQRQQTRTIDQLFLVSHIAVARYCNPVTGEVWSLEDCLEHVKLQQSMFKLNRGKLSCVGITPWKRGYVKQYLRSPDGEVVFGDVKDLAEDSTPVTWSFREFADHAETSDPRGANQRAVYRIEDGFLRSTGLGSDFTAPGSLVVDQNGLYFDPASSSDLQGLLNGFDCRPKDIQRAARLRQHIVKSGISKYNIGESVQLFAPPVDKRCVLVVGQVEDDQSVQRGCDGIGSNEALLKAVRANEPDAWIVYKPHPDVEAGNRKGIVAPNVLQDVADFVDRNSDIAACLDRCDELHTMTSLAGFEALMRGKKVVTYGAPFYAGWGLTNDELELPARHRIRTIDEMVFIVLIKYPRYVDIETGDFTTPESLISRIEQLKISAHSAQSKTWVHRQLNKVVNIYRGVRYAP